MVDVNSAEPNAAQKPVPVPAVIAVMNAPTISTAKPIKSFATKKDYLHYQCRLQDCLSNKRIDLNHLQSY